MVSYLKSKDISAEIYNADIYQRSPLTGLPGRIVKACKARLLRRSWRHSFNVDFARAWPSYHAKVGDAQSDIWRSVGRALATLHPGIIAISSKVVDIPSTFMLAEIAKRTLPDTPVIVGGPSAITCAQHLMQNPAIDYLVLGEGEITMSELAQAILSGTITEQRAAILGLGYRNAHGDLVLNKPRPLVENLDQIPFPDRRAMFMVDHRGDKKYLLELADLLTSRGCPYPCTFCCAYKAWGTRKARFRSVANIMDEITFLYREYGQKAFIFWDDLFTSDRARVVAICEEILRRQLDINWICLTRLNTIDEELLEIMKSAGCREVQIGIESGNDRILKFIQKGISRKMIFDKVPILKKVGMPWRIFLIIGFPTETREEISDTLKLIDEIRPTYVDLSLFCPYPGTELHNFLQERNELGADFMKSDMWYPYHNYTGTMSDDSFQTCAFAALKLADDYSAAQS